MLLFSYPVRALVAAILLNNVFPAFASHARFHKHMLAHRSIHLKDLRSHDDSVLPIRDIRERDNITALDTQPLRVEINSFSQWMSVWFASANATNSPASIAQVQKEVQSHKASVKAWLDAVASNGASSASSSNIQQIEAESTAFNQWMDAWATSASATTPSSAISELQQEVQAYEGWINTWLNVATNSLSPVSTSSLTDASSTLINANAGIVLTSTASLGGRTTTLTTTAFVTSTLTKVATETVITTPLSSSSVGPSSMSGNQFLQQTSSGNTTAAATSSVATSFAFQPTSQPTSQLAPPSTSSAVAQSSAPAVPNSGSGFNPDASDNVAVYFGQTPATASVPLDQLCSNPNINIVVIAFVNNFFSAGNEPSVNFGVAGGNTLSAAAAAIGATGLLSSPDLASKITTCQQQGKVILLSLGGAIGTTTFTSDSQATGFAQQLWDLFGGGTGSPDLRPFGSVKVDGFDIDNESHDPTGYTALTTSLRSLFASDGSKRYYLSAAPQCPRPDASIPLDAMQAMDFVWVQFYNNGDCNVGQSSFLSSFQSWSSDLSAKGQGPKLFVGALASPGSGTGYLESGDMEKALGGAKGAGVPNFGGAMLWDGSEAVVNGGYESGVKGALG